MALYLVFFKITVHCVLCAIIFLSSAVSAASKHGIIICWEKFQQRQYESSIQCAEEMHRKDQAPFYQRELASLHEQIGIIYLQREDQRACGHIYHAHDLYQKYFRIHKPKLSKSEREKREKHLEQLTKLGNFASLTITSTYKALVVDIRAQAQFKYHFQTQKITTPYTFAYLCPDVYTISSNMSGYKDYRRTINISAQQKLHLSISMQKLPFPNWGWSFIASGILAAAGGISFGFNRHFSNEFRELPSKTDAATKLSEQMTWSLIMGYALITGAVIAGTTGVILYFRDKRKTQTKSQTSSLPANMMQNQILFETSL